MHPRLAQLAVAQAADGVVFVQALLRLGRRLDVPFQQRQPQRARHLPRQFGLARAGFALHQQGALQGHRRVHRNRQVGGRHIARGRCEFHCCINILTVRLAQTLPLARKSRNR